MLQRYIRRLLRGNKIRIVFFLLTVEFSTNSFKFAGTSPGMYKNNHSATFTNEYINVPSRSRWNVTLGTDRRMNPSCQVCFLFILKIRPPTREPISNRCICDGPLSGTRCATNKKPDLTRLENFQNYYPLKPPTPHFYHFFPSFSHSLPLKLPTSYLSSLSTFQFPKSPILEIFFLLVRVCCCSSALNN